MAATEGLPGHFTPLGRFLREMDYSNATLGYVQHPHILPLEDSGKNVLGYCHVGNLQRWEKYSGLVLQ